MTDPLIDAALRARENAHAPFSKFKVGAAVEDSAGVFTPDATWRTRLTALHVRGAGGYFQGDFGRREAVSRAWQWRPIPNVDAACGACRQILWEFCGDMEIVLVNLEGKSETLRLGDLFPRPFDNSFIDRTS